MSSNNLEVLISLGFKKGDIADIDEVIKKLKEIESKGVNLKESTNTADVKRDINEGFKKIEDLFKDKPAQEANEDINVEIGKLSSNISQLQYNLFAHAIFPKAGNIGAIKSLQAAQGRGEEFLLDMAKNKSGSVIEGMSPQEYAKWYAPMVERVISDTMVKLINGVSEEKVSGILGVIDMLRDPNQAEKFFGAFKPTLLGAYGSEEDWQKETFDITKRNAKVDLEDQGLRFNFLQYMAAMESNPIPMLGDISRPEIGKDETNRLQDLATKHNLDPKTKLSLDEFMPITKNKKGDMEYKQFSGTMLLGDKLYDELKAKQQDVLKGLNFDEKEVKEIMDSIFTNKVPDAIVTAIDNDKFRQATADSLTAAYKKAKPEAFEEGVKVFMEQVINNRENMLKLAKEGMTGVSIFPFAMRGTNRKLWDEIAKNPLLYQILEKNLMAASGDVGTLTPVKGPTQKSVDIITEWKNKPESERKMLEGNSIKLLEQMAEALGGLENLNKLIKELNKDADKVGLNG